MTDTASETNLGTAITDRADRPRNPNTARSYRSVATHSQTAEHLGPLADLPGFWQGTGFSLIARPDVRPDEPLRVLPAAQPPARDFGVQPHRVAGAEPRQQAE